MQRSLPERWEDCVKRDVRNAGEEEDWKKKKTEENGKEYQMMRRTSCRQHLTPDKGKTRKRERCIHFRRSRDCFCLYVSVCVCVCVCVREIRGNKRFLRSG